MYSKFEECLQQFCDVLLVPFEVCWHFVVVVEAFVVDEVDGCAPLLLDTDFGICSLIGGDMLVNPVA